MDDATPAPRKTTGLAVAAFSVGLVGLAVVVVISLGSYGPRHAGEDALLFIGGLALLLAVAAGVELVARRRTHRGAWLALGGGVLGLGELFRWLISGLGGLHGRPLRLHGRVAMAPTTANDAWIAGAAPDLERLTPELRERLGMEWLQDAREEHASIPAFSLLSLHLTRLGAPPELVIASHQAALDEVSHARRCFALASAYLGRSCGPAGWPALASASHEVDLATLACEALADGCVGEGTAAEVAAAAAAQACDPVVRVMLVEIARDEARHAALAWDVLAWALASGGETVAQAVTACARALPVAVVAEGDASLAGHGRLPAGEAAALRRRVVAAARARLVGMLPATRAA